MINLLDAIYSRLGVEASQDELDVVVPLPYWGQFNRAESHEDEQCAVDDIVACYEAWLDSGESLEQARHRRSLEPAEYQLC